MFGKKKIGIALSGGAARGIAHIGVLQVLNELGVEIHAVSGTSMGAIIGAIYALGISFEEVINYIKNTDWRSFLILSALGLSRRGILNDKKVDDVLSNFLGNKTFDDCIKPFCCVAVDIISGKKVILNSGKLKEAVRASISVPGIFSPVYKDGGLLIDGGVIEPLPTESIEIFNCNFIIASSIVFDKYEEYNVADLSKTSETQKLAKIGKKDENITGKNRVKQGKFKEDKKSSGLINSPDKQICNLSIQTILDKSLTIMHAQMVKNYLQKANIIIEPKVGNFGFFDFAKGEKIIAAGRKAAEEKIPEIKQKLRIR